MCCRSVGLSLQRSSRSMNTRGSSATVRLRDCVRSEVLIQTSRSPTHYLVQYVVRRSLHQPSTTYYQYQSTTSSSTTVRTSMVRTAALF